MRTMTDSDKKEYCDKCGNPEFDKDGYKTHDYEPYDHDFVYEDEEEESLTLKDVKDIADTIKSVVEAGKVLKNIPQIPPKPSRWEESERIFNANPLSFVTIVIFIFLANSKI